MRAVFDANVFVQAVINVDGAGFACLERVRTGAVRFVVTEAILAEIDEAVERIAGKKKYAAQTSGRVAGLFRFVQTVAEIHPEPPCALRLDRDPDGEVYVSLAVATGATLLTTSDKDLLHLMDAATAIGAEFRGRFPDLAIVTPPEFLARMRALGF